MNKCVLLWLLVASSAACTQSSGPGNAPPVEPLVIGTSPAPIATAPGPTPPHDEPIAPLATLAIPARDPRLHTSRPRPRALVITEITQLEVGFAAAATASPDRPVLARRLAEDYVELTRTVDAPTAKRAHEKAFAYYDVITKDHPNYAHLDEAHYYGALEHELAGDLMGARRGYFELIKTSPSSPLIPLAYFAFAEMFLVEAETDSTKDQLAEQAYNEVLKYPPPGNTVYAEAQRRLGEIHGRRNASPTPVPIKRP